MKKSIVALGMVLALSGCAAAADETLAAEPAALVEISPATEETAQPVEAAATAEPAGKALLGLLGLALNSEKPVPIGYFKGMELQIQHLPFGNEYHARLAGSGTYSTQLGADVLGNLTRLSNLANGIEPSIEKTRNMQIQLEQQLASAEEEVKRPFPQATELTEKSKRLAVLEGLLNMNDKDIVTDTEPEQQCQADNRQRGQEER